MTDTFIEHKLVWPPAYTIRKSLRARHIFLQINPLQGLEVVIPNRQKQFNIDKILNEKRAWVEKMLFQTKKRLLNIDPSNLEKPSLITCKATQETWQVCYEPPLNSKKIILSAHSHPQKTLLLKGNTENIKLCHRILTRWLIKHAHITLIPWLEKLSALTGLSYNRVIIRGQSTLWGSCNAKKNISLNYKLLFLPPSLVQYVLLHELCHTKHLNHSSQFWQYLKTMDTHCADNKKALKTAEHYLPQWLYRV